MRPAAASMMIRPVGVGRTSPGPIGVDGLTLTAGNFCSATMASTRRSVHDLAVFVGRRTRVFRGERITSSSLGARFGRDANVATLDV